MMNFNKNKLKLFLENMDNEKRNVYNKIINKSILIKDDYLFELLKISIDKFHEKYDKYNIFLPNFKIGSEHWIFIELFKNNNIFNLHPEYIMYGIEKEFPNNYPVIIMDDAIYSGCNMMCNVDNLTYENNKIKNKFYSIVAITSYNFNNSNKEHQIFDYFEEVISGIHFEELTISNLLTIDEINKYFPNNFGSTIPLFFEHKVANEFGSYQFFKEIVDIDRSKINNITNNDINEIIKNFNK